MKPVHVAVAVIRRNGSILVSRRSADVHQGGLWEFPGGKVEAGENVLQALRRELAEELGIEVDVSLCQHLIDIHHDYGDKRVWLDVWVVDHFSGEPFGREGQPLSWLKPQELAGLQFPAANLPIITACRLPRYYAITPELDDPESIQRWFEGVLRSECQPLILWRHPTMRQHEPARYLRLGEFLLDQCHTHSLEMLLSGPPELLDTLAADGVHVPARYLSRMLADPDREVATSKKSWLACSCHSLAELQQAQSLGADFCTLSPLLPTRSHPEGESMGWKLFTELCAAATLPVFALGGLEMGHLDQIVRAGGQGIAGIGLWI